MELIEACLTACLLEMPASASEPLTANTRQSLLPNLSLLHYIFTHFCSVGFKCLWISEWGMCFWFVVWLFFGGFSPWNNWGCKLWSSSSISIINLAVFYDRLPRWRTQGWQKMFPNFTLVHMEFFTHRRNALERSDILWPLPSWAVEDPGGAGTWLSGFCAPSAVPQWWDVSICVGMDEPGHRENAQPSVTAAVSLAPKMVLETLVQATEPYSGCLGNLPEISCR